MRIRLFCCNSGVRGVLLGHLTQFTRKWEVPCLRSPRAGLSAPLRLERCRTPFSDSTFTLHTVLRCCHSFLTFLLQFHQSNPKTQIIGMSDHHIHHQMTSDHAIEHATHAGANHSHGPSAHEVAQNHDNISQQNVLESSASLENSASLDNLHAGTKRAFPSDEYVSLGGN